MSIPVRKLRLRVRITNVYNRTLHKNFFDTIEYLVLGHMQLHTRQLRLLFRTRDCECTEVSVIHFQLEVELSKKHWRRRGSES
jgi:hypothetical protein